jgi:hypothetical protein
MFFVVSFLNFKNVKMFKVFHKIKLLIAIILKIIELQMIFKAFK